MTDQTGNLNKLSSKKEVERDVSIQRCYNIHSKICSFQHKIETPKKNRKKKNTEKYNLYTRKRYRNLQVLRVIVNET